MAWIHVAQVSSEVSWCHLSRAFESRMVAPIAGIEVVANLSIEYRPFSSLDSTNHPAIIGYPSSGSGSGAGVFYLTIGDLISQPSN
jgi:hypothetical protein